MKDPISKRVLDFIFKVKPNSIAEDEVGDLDSPAKEILESLEERFETWEKKLTSTDKDSRKCREVFTLTDTLTGFTLSKEYERVMGCSRTLMKVSPEWLSTHEVDLISKRYCELEYIFKDKALQEERNKVTIAYQNLKEQENESN